MTYVVPKAVGETGKEDKLADLDVWTDKTTAFGKDTKKTKAAADATTVEVAVTSAGIYYVQMRATTAKLYNGAWSTPALKVFAATKPDAPTKLAQVGFSDSKVSISWFPAVNNGLGVNLYTVYSSTTAGTTKVAYTKKETETKGPVTSWTQAATSTLYFKVTATNEIDESAQ